MVCLKKKNNIYIYGTLESCVCVCQPHTQAPTYKTITNTHVCAFVCVCLHIISACAHTHHWNRLFCHSRRKKTKRWEFPFSSFFYFSPTIYLYILLYIKGGKEEGGLYLQQQQPPPSSLLLVPLHMFHFFIWCLA